MRLPKVTSTSHSAIAGSASARVAARTTFAAGNRAASPAPTASTMMRSAQTRMVAAIRYGMRMPAKAYAVRTSPPPQSDLEIVARIHFTAQLQRFVSAPCCEVVATTVRDALDAVFADHRTLRGYVLDDQGHLRKHVVIFVDGVRVRDRATLADPLGPASEVHVLQALSGG